MGAVYNGTELFNEGNKLLQKGYYEDAATKLWASIMHHGSSSDYTIEMAFINFMECYKLLGNIADGYVYVAKEYLVRNDENSAKSYLQAALQMDPKNQGALRMMGAMDSNSSEKSVEDEDVMSLVSRGNEYFNEKKWKQAVEAFEEACQKSEEKVALACTHAAYCRTSILDWGENNRQFEIDMKRVEDFTRGEKSAFRSVGLDGTISWVLPTSVHPHMMLAYPVDPNLQLVSSESYTVFEGKKTENSINHEIKRARHLEESNKTDFKIKVGFVGAGFNSKAVLYLSHDMFRFFDTSRFEVHILALNEPDHEQFIRVAMNGVDWRARVRGWVDYFWEVEDIRNDGAALANFIQEKDIHILIDWDGFAREGLRSDGLFPKRSAPIQILHQEFLGTTGSPYIDYLFTDERVSPLHLQHLYSEKFIYMPYHFFSKGHAVQKEVAPPAFEHEAATVPYTSGTGSPQENKCLATDANNPTFVFCNVHKFLKYNPETLNSWLDILERVPDSMLCILKNPPDGAMNLRKLISDRDPALNERVHLLDWENSPFKHQRRNGDLCNAVLDTWPYNGHTTTMDALYAGVPIVTRSDGEYMSSRVTTSANIVLGIPEMNANGFEEYVDTAVKLATNDAFFNSIRNRIIESALMENPMHVFWDVKNYVENFETGLQLAWERYISNKEPAHIRIAANSYVEDSVKDKDEL